MKKKSVTIRAAWIGAIALITGSLILGLFNLLDDLKKKENMVGFFSEEQIKKLFENHRKESILRNKPLSKNDIPAELNQINPQLYNDLLILADNPNIPDFIKIDDELSKIIAKVKNKKILSYLYYIKGVLNDNVASRKIADKNNVKEAINHLYHAKEYYLESFQLNNNNTKAALEYDSTCMSLILNEEGYLFTTNWRGLSEKFKQLKVDQLRVLQRALSFAELKSEIYSRIICVLLEIFELKKAAIQMEEWYNYNQINNDPTTKEHFKTHMIFWPIIHRMQGNTSEKEEFLFHAVKMGVDQNLIDYDYIYNQDKIYSEVLAVIFSRFGLGEETSKLLSDKHDPLETFDEYSVSIAELYIFSEILAIDCIEKDVRFNIKDINNFDQYKDINEECYKNVIDLLENKMKEKPYSEVIHYWLGYSLHRYAMIALLSQEEKKKIINKANKHMIVAHVNHFAHTLNTAPKRWQDTVLALNEPGHTISIPNEEFLEYIDPQFEDIDKIPLPDDITVKE